MSISTPNAISTPNTSPTITTDALIIGFGKGGKTLAAKLSAAGRKVVVAEASADMYGGTCINIGCLPSKSLILSAEQARRDGANSTPETREAAFEAAIKEKRRVTSMLRDKNYHKLADQDNITVITGRAHFTGPHSVEIATAEGPVAVTASKIFINTGATPRIPDIPGIHTTPGVYTSTGPRIQLVSATAGFGSACFDCSLAISSSHTSLGVLYPRSFMGVSLISPTIASSSSCVRSSKLVPLGR